jgi:hypothetical protein
VEGWLMKANKNKRSLTTLAALTMLGGAIGTLSARAGDWTDASICGAGLYNYFFLKSPPEHIGATGGWLVFRSASGATYDCQLQGDVVAFRWKNDSGPMASQSTRFDANGNVLTIRGDLGTALFRLAYGTWSPVE